MFAQVDARRILEGAITGFMQRCWAKSLGNMIVVRPLERSMG